jgi:hypothetical protein
LVVSVYSVGTITKVGTATFTANHPGNLTGVSPAVTATGITGDNSAAWNPTISVAVHNRAGSQMIYEVKVRPRVIAFGDWDVDDAHADARRRCHMPNRSRAHRRARGRGRNDHERDARQRAPRKC